jgi:hypothetical protein
MATIYIHRRKDIEDPFLNVFYVGCTIKPHRPYCKNRSKKWHLAAQNGYDVEILKENLPIEEAWQEEKRLIMFYGRKDLGLGNLVNMTNGGKGTEKCLWGKGESNGMYGKRHTEEAIKKMSQNRKLGFTEEKRKEISVRAAKMYKGEGNPMYGRKHSEETKRKIGLKSKERNAIQNALNARKK